MKSWDCRKFLECGCNVVLSFDETKSCLSPPLPLLLRSSTSQWPSCWFGRAMTSASQDIRTLLIGRTYTQTKRKYHSNLVHTHRAPSCHDEALRHASFCSQSFSENSHHRFTSELFGPPKFLKSKTRKPFVRILFFSLFQFILLDFNLFGSICYLFGKKLLPLKIHSPSP